MISRNPQQLSNHFVSIPRQPIFCLPFYSQYVIEINKLIWYEVAQLNKLETFVSDRFRSALVKRKYANDIPFEDLNSKEKGKEEFYDIWNRRNFHMKWKRVKWRLDWSVMKELIQLQVRDNELLEEISEM